MSAASEDTLMKIFKLSHYFRCVNDGKVSQLNGICMFQARRWKAFVRDSQGFH